MLDEDEGNWVGIANVCWLKRSDLRDLVQHDQPIVYTFSGDACLPTLLISGNHLYSMHGL